MMEDLVIKKNKKNMNPFETPPDDKDKLLDAEQMSRNAEREKINELFFQQYIETEMEAELFREIEKGGFTPEQIIELRKSFSELGEQEKEFAFAMPYELRKRNFKYQAGQIKAGKKDIADFWNPIIKLGLMNGRRLGYHISKYDVNPTIERGKTEETWSIKGYEKDHRNDDQEMAYYSEDYKNLYRSKGGNFLYIISSLRGTNGGHHVDNTNRWGRAQFLEVIQKFDLRKVDEFVRERTKEYMEKKDTPTE